MLRGCFGNLIFAIIARMLCRNHLNSFDLVVYMEVSMDLLYFGALVLHTKGAVTQCNVPCNLSRNALPDKLSKSLQKVGLCFTFHNGFIMRSRTAGIFCRLQVEI